jgi:hypothetical protein
MTYYSKYLKYKNKYLELKNMIGGNLKESELNKLWGERKKADKVFPVTFTGFQNHYSEYCWISGKKYGTGFFLYKFNNHLANKTPYYFKKIRHTKIDNIDNYALWYLEVTDIIQPLEKVEKEYNDSDKLLYKTTIKLSVNDGSTLPIGSNFDWDHQQSAWIYTKKDQKQPYYKTTLNPALFS